MSKPVAWLLALLWSAGCALAVTAAAWPADRILGVRNNDLYGALWYRWYLAESLERGWSAAVTPLVAWPLGTDMLVRDGCNLLDAALALPLVAWLGPLGAHDAWAGGVILANGLAFFRLSEVWRGDDRAGVAAGLLGAALFALAVVPLEELGAGRPTQAFLPFLCLGLRAAWRLDTERFAWAWGGLWLALTGLTYWYAAAWGGLVLLGVGLTRSPRRAVAMGALALALVSPLLALVATHMAHGPGLPALAHPDYHPLFVLDATGWTALISPDGGLTTVPAGMGRVVWGSLPLGALALGVLVRRDRAWVAMAVAATLCVGLALGPRPLGLLDSPLYTAFLALGPLADRMWFPTRALVVVDLVAAAAISAAAARWLGRGALPLAAALSVGWGLSLVPGALLPLPTWRPPHPPALDWLAAQPDAAVVALPVGADSLWRVHQVWHGKPVQASLGGSNPLLAVDGHAEWAAGQPALALLDEILMGRKPSRRFTDADWQPLLDDGFGYLIVDTATLSADRTPEMVDLTVKRLGRAVGPPTRQGPGLLIWTLPPGGDR
ncbi:MAG: hypothetical protein H6739_26780 [Alphaproteobacteria bacterium]|nr:hypothetical protein [Alphaproteobacteria bacterium]